MQTRITGRAPELREGMPIAAGVTDAADMMRRGIPTAIYGPADFRTEANESVLVADLITAARVYAGVTAEITSRPRE